MFPILVTLYNTTSTFNDLYLFNMAIYMHSWTSINIYFIIDSFYDLGSFELQQRFIK